MRVARSGELVAQGRPAALVARVCGVSRQAIYRRATRPPKGQRRRLSATDRVVLEVARENPTDGTRMGAALARRRRPGFFRVERPDELWHRDIPRSGSPSTAGAI
jgi:putative transposase